MRQANKVNGRLTPLKLIAKEHNATVAAMEAAGVQMTRANYLYWMSGGEITGDVELDPEVENELPMQFQQRTLVETPSATEEVQ